MLLDRKAIGPPREEFLLWDAIGLGGRRSIDLQFSHAQGGGISELRKSL